MSAFVFLSGLDCCGVRVKRRRATGGAVYSTVLDSGALQLHEELSINSSKNEYE